MSSIVLAVGNGKTLFGGAGVAPDADLVRFVDPESPIINAFDLCALRGDGIFEATTVWKGFPVSLENHLKRLANSARLVDMPEPNIPALTRAVQLVIDQYDDPEPGPMLRIIVSRGLDPDTGVGKAADRTPTVYIFLDAKGTLHSLEPIAELREADSLYMTHGGWSIPISAIDGRALAVDAAEIQAINDAIHSGRTHEDALKIGPTGDYE